MGKPTGFLDFPRELPLARPPQTRVGDWREFHEHADDTTHHLPDEVRSFNRDQHEIAAALDVEAFDEDDRRALDARLVVFFRERLEIALADERFGDREVA